MTELTIPARFSGPPTSANGGYTAGLLAAALAGDGDTLPKTPVEVTLRKPPPMETAIPLQPAEDGHLVAGGEDGVVAEAKVYGGELEPVAPVTYDEAAAAQASYPGLVRHPFPRCFVCGPDRAEGDGLRIFPGKVGETDGGLLRVAATWTPGESVAEEPGLASLPATWAALDCTGGWAGDLTERWMVLGRLTGLVHSLPAIGAPHVVVGEGRAAEGRKAFTATSLYDDAGTLLATAEHVWISVASGAPGWSTTAPRSSTDPAAFS
ncbi:hypothetical protein [Nocardioides speluncae]|uniref:hypothetical protein n=1 Tax=Nocardioides speluncae TaxID=2670337 RepID=UPI0019813289|nr:hypothetical protein [Nocardioides speluncae]